MERKKTVLVVEDEPALLEAVKLKLEKAGIEAWPAKNGEEAIVLLTQKRPSLIWLDVLLPGMNGLEILRRVRDDQNLKDTPVVVVSVSSSPEKIQQAFSMNVLDYIAKSEFTIDEIVGKIKDLLEKLE